MESHEAGFPPFPHSLEIPSGFPHSQSLDDAAPIENLKKGFVPLQGPVTDVSGPKCNG